MWRYPAVLLALSVAASTANHRTTPPPEALLGRWDITIHTPTGDRPSWLEMW